MLRGGVGAASAAFLLRGGLESAFADTVASSGTVAGGFVVNGRHLAFGPDPRRQMWVAGQLFNLNTYSAIPSGIKVDVEYGHDGSYGRVVRAEIRELITHVPVWNGVVRGPISASTTDLPNADQFYVHALLDDLEPGENYHYRFSYCHGNERGYTPNATFTTAPTVVTCSRSRSPPMATKGSPVRPVPDKSLTMPSRCSLSPRATSPTTTATVAVLITTTRPRPPPRPTSPRSMHSSRR